MTPPRSDAGAVRVSDAELKAMLARAAEVGARRALSDVGLGGKDAVLTIHDMRSLLECIQFVRRAPVPRLDALRGAPGRKDRRPMNHPAQTHAKDSHHVAIVPLPR
jgi:hypothetical protein